MKLCLSTFQSIRAFISLGLPPGSFAVNLLLGDHAAAYNCAHPKLKEKDPDGYDAVLGMLNLCQLTLPSGLFTTIRDIEQWEHFGGLRGCSEASRISIYMMSKVWFLPCYPEQPPHKFEASILDWLDPHANW